MNIFDLEVEHPVSLVVTVGLKSNDLNTVIKYIQKDYILLEPILIEERTVGFGPGCSIDLLYVNEQNVYAWSNVSLPLVKRKNEMLYQVFLPGDAKPYNRRGAFRVYIGETMSVTVFQSEGPKSFNVLIRDISETGFGFVSKEEFVLSRTIRLVLSLSNRKSISLSATIVRKNFIEEKAVYSYGCKFVEKNDILSAYLMAKQREKQQEKMAAGKKLAGLKEFK